jgi:predicted AAA+ superfamily ATPase
VQFKKWVEISKNRAYNTNMSDQKRNILRKIDDQLGYFPVVIILGVRQCGKTTLAKCLSLTGGIWILNEAGITTLLQMTLIFY